MNSTKQILVLTLALLAVIAGVVALSIRGARHRSPTRPPVAAGTSAVANVPATLAPASLPPRNLPAGWEGFTSLKPAAQLNRVTAAMEDHNAKDPNDGIRRCAIAALGLIGTPDDLPLIQPGLTDRNRAVQLAAKAAEERIRARCSSSDKSEG